MVKPWRRAVFGMVSVCMIAIGGRAFADDACQLKMVASLDFTSTDEYAVIVPVTLANVPVKMLVDTGGVATTISDDWARDHLLRKTQTGAR